jgi:cytochrome c
MRPHHIPIIASMGLALGSQASLAEPNAQAGKEIFQAQCSPCHSDQPGVNGVGPSLAGLAGRKAGSLVGFKYTPALQNSGLSWDAHTFDQFMIDPAKKVAGTAIAVMLPEASDRRTSRPPAHRASCVAGPIRGDDLRQRLGLFWWRWFAGGRHLCAAVTLGRAPMQ